MAKKFGKTKQEVEEVELEAEDSEVEVEDEPEDEDEVEEEIVEPEPPKKVVRRTKVVQQEEPAEEEVEEEIEAEEKPAKKKKATTAPAEEPGAPRARKFQYGITDASTIARVKDAECPSSVADQWGYAKTGTTVSAFYDAGGDRHGLRVMMRAGAIKLKTGGETYPQAWDDAQVSRPKAKKVVEPVEEAPAPKRRTRKK